MDNMLKYVPWIQTLHCLHTETYPSAINLSTFVQRILLPALETTQQCPEDLCLIRALRSTPVSDLGRIQYNADTMPDLLIGLRLNVLIWQRDAKSLAAPKQLNTICFIMFFTQRSL
jgi:hypothetical protein